ncbi:MAG: septum formation inhibitor Maf [Acidimicrobiia bacterium]|nr:septum formation inhibitor Maf [Acidimicrobiia bacterium]
MPPARRLVLASASPARLRLLVDSGFAPEVVVSDVDEDAVEARSILELVDALAVAKAGAVASRAEVAGAVVVGCDSMLDVDGEAHGKPTSVEQARQRLQQLRGRTAILRTGHCVIDTDTGKRARDVESTGVLFGRFDDRELDAYLGTGEALHVAGSFTLDGRSAPMLDGIVGNPSNVIGLSLPLLRRLLGEVDVWWPDLWA